MGSFEGGQKHLLLGDMLQILPRIASDSIDAVVTDPPYHLSSIVKRFGKAGSAPAQHGKDGLYARASAGFMGKEWDGGDIAFRPETWAEVLRVMKPGAHLLAFGGTRGYHRMTCAIEDAGFEIRDSIMWLYGSGFPKSHNAGNGWGTALKPAYEPIVLARKALIGTVAENVLQHGTGAINIDACRVEGIKDVPASPRRAVQGVTFGDLSNDPGTGSGWDPNVGRWPANIIHDGSEEVLEAFPYTKSREDVSVKKSSAAEQNGNRGAALGKESRPAGSVMISYGDEGSASRFFYCAKASKSDRNEGCDSLPDMPAGMVSETSGQHVTRRDGGAPTVTKNNHPTVKPTALMRYLCRLITPQNGYILDPFMGSGSTGKAALAEGFNFIGIERDAQYMEIAKARVA